MQRHRCLQAAKSSISNIPNESTLKELYKLLGLFVHTSQPPKDWIEL